MQLFCAIFGVILSIAFVGCEPRNVTQQSTPRSTQTTAPVEQALPESAPRQLRQMLGGAIEQIGITTHYDPAYVRLDYPGGDVPRETGVCSDVLVRAFRSAGIDLQKEVHEDMRAAFGVYPRRWGLTKPDTNIDHRRVLNLMTFFERKGKALPLTMERKDYLPGDLVAWDLGGGIPHIGVVSSLATAPDKHFLVIHNIGAGARAEDVLFNWKITGHYRYF